MKIFAIIVVLVTNGEKGAGLMRKRTSNIIWSKLLLLLSFCLQGCDEVVESKKTNILICIADDVSYPHMGEACSWTKTPAFERA